MSEDHPTVENVPLQDDDEPAIEDNIRSRSTWLRGLFMLLACALLGLASMVGGFVVMLGFSCARPAKASRPISMKVLVS
jgi:hypothetical protein